MIESFPTTLDEIQKELLQHSKDGRSDAGFRLNIALSQMGSLAAHFTHDRIENPTSRPYGSKDGEISDAGHALAQIMTYVALRDINLQDALNSALTNLREKDFIARITTDVSEVKGIVASNGGDGVETGIAFVDDFCHKLDFIPKGSILVANHPTCDIYRAIQKGCKGVITNHGGMMCHAAIVAREHGLPCIVGTGNATHMIRTGDDIILDMITGKVSLGVRK